MSFYKLYETFMDETSNMKKVDFREMLTEQKHARHYQIELYARFEAEAGGNIEDRLTRIRSIKGVTIVSKQEGTPARSVIRVKFHPELDAMRASTYVRTILMPDINSSSKVPGVHVLGIVRGSLKQLEI
jgi:hypothetical protein